jgi:hypothetical protein
MTGLPQDPLGLGLVSFFPHPCPLLPARTYWHLGGGGGGPGLALSVMKPALTSQAVHAPCSTLPSVWSFGSLPSLGLLSLC